MNKETATKPDRPSTPKPRRWLRRLSFILGTYIVFLLFVFFGGCADKLILHPSTHPLDGHGAQRIAIPFNGGTLEAWTARSPGAKDSEPKLVQIEFVGNGGRAEWIPAGLAKQWGDRPVEVWAINYPGYGGSTGPAAMRLIPPAALAAYDAAAVAHPGRPILLSGHSLGTTAATYVATQRPCAGLFLQNPPPLRRLILREYGWWNLWLVAGPVAMQVPSTLDILANGRRVTCPAVISVGMRDTFVPTKLQLEVAEAYAGPKRIIRFEGDHNSWANGPEVDAGLTWLYEQAVPAARPGR